jgi:hypothetical protein
MTDKKGDTGDFRVPGSGDSGARRKLSATDPSRLAGAHLKAGPGTDPRHKPKFKEFRLTSFAIDHPTSIVVMTVILILMGLMSYIRVPKEMAPEIVVPFVLINTVYAGVAPGDIETLITEPLEDELNTIGDIKTITSISAESYSMISIEFAAGMDMNEALQRVREKVDIAKPELPPAAEEPEIIEINFSDFPIMQVNIAGDYNEVRLRELAEDMQDRLEQIPSVLEARLAGGLEREVQVDVDLAKLKFYDVTLDDVIDAVRFENVTVPGGSIDVGDVKFLVRVPGEFEETAPIADIVVLTRNGRPIYVRDLATVDFGFKERESLARLDGNPVISLAIIKRSGENIIATADDVHAVIADMERDFPPGTVVLITSDVSSDIQDMVSSLENNIISGLILVVAVLIFVLGVRTAPFVGLAIPLSMLLSFSIIRFVGFSMNMVVLFSLILALGMLVDNAIVVINGDDAGRVLSHDVLARHRGRVHEVPAAHADHHAQLVAVRGAGDTADPGGPHAGHGGRSGRNDAGIPQAALGSGRIYGRCADVREPAHRHSAARDRSGRVRVPSLLGAPGGTLAHDAGPAAVHRAVRVGAALGPGTPVAHDRRGGGFARPRGDGVRRVQRGRRVLPRERPAHHGLHPGGGAPRDPARGDGPDRDRDRGAARRARGWGGC